MLSNIDTKNKLYTITASEWSNLDELVADFSILDGLPPGDVYIDMRGRLNNCAKLSNVTMSMSTNKAPSYLGAYSLEPLTQQLSFIRRKTIIPIFMPNYFDYQVVLPVSTSVISNFYQSIKLMDLLQRWKIPYKTQWMWEPKNIYDDESRIVLIPLCDILQRTNQSELLKHWSEDIHIQFLKIFDANYVGSIRLITIVIQFVEILCTLCDGGVICCVYFPKTGYLELSITNYINGVFENNPQSQLLFLKEWIDKFQQLDSKEYLEKLMGSLKLTYGQASAILTVDGKVITEFNELGLPSVHYPGISIYAILQIPPTSITHWGATGIENANLTWQNLMN